MRHYVTSAVSKCTFELNIFILQCMSDYLPSRLLSTLSYDYFFFFIRCTECCSMLCHNNSHSHSHSIALDAIYIIQKRILRIKHIFMSLGSVLSLALR